MQWFDVDKAGLAKILARRGKEFILYELIQNTWDENTTEVSISLMRVPATKYVELRVVDDNPTGFTNLTHAFTLFAESDKKADATKRGRFNLGEKLVLALCEEASIKSTTGTVVFDSGGRRTIREKTKSGSVFNGTIRMTDEEMKRCEEMVYRLLPPRHILTSYNGVALRPRSALHITSAVLATEIADANGYLNKTKRRATLEIHDTLSGETGTLYEMGIPIVETGDRWHVNVMQKVPLNLDRDNVSPAYLSSVRAAVLEQVSHLLTADDATSSWVKDAVQKHGHAMSPSTIADVPLNIPPDPHPKPEPK